ncbi:MAG: Dabb family protein [Ruthenibacterium sp.]
MLKHIVFWKINENGTRQERLATAEAFRQKTEYLKTILPQIKEAAVGFNIVEGDVFHVCIDSLFENEAALQAYLCHPEHLKVRAFMNTVSYDKAVFDYEL